MDLVNLIASHPAATLMVVGALVSTFYQRLDKYPKLHAFFGCLAHAGVNLPGVADALTKLVTSAAAKTLAVIAFTVAATGGAIMLFLNIQACTPAQAAPDVQTAQTLVADAYVLAGQACIDLADSAVDPKAAKACATALIAAGNDLLVAEADATDACNLVAVARDLAAVPYPGGAPTAVVSALAVLQVVTSGCSALDAGTE